MEGFGCCACRFAVVLDIVCNYKCSLMQFLTPHQFILLKKKKKHLIPHDMTTFKCQFTLAEAPAVLPELAALLRGCLGAVYWKDSFPWLAA